MGHWMAEIILSKGHDLIVLEHQNWDPNDALIGLGFCQTATACELAQLSSIVFLPAGLAPSQGINAKDVIRSDGKRVPVS